MNEREKIIHLWFEMWLTKQDLGIDNIFAEDVIYTESWDALDWYSRNAAFTARRTVRADSFVVEIIRLKDFCSISSCNAITSHAAECF